MSIEILKKNESVKYLGQRISFHQQKTLEIKSKDQSSLGDIPQIQTRIDIKKIHAQGNQKQDQSSLGDISQIQTGIDIKEIHAQNPSTPLRRQSFSDSMLRRQEHGHRAQEHERMIQSTQRKMLRLVIQTERKYKKIEKQVIEHKDEEGIADKTGKL